jgi:Fic family protein
MYMSSANNTPNDEFALQLVEPDWNSPLASTIVELEQLRVRRLAGTVPPHIFFQLKEIFHFLESLGSARIEGNQTTLAEWVDQRIADKSASKNEQAREIINIEAAIDFIEEVVTADFQFDRAFVSEIHKYIVQDLTLPPEGEGSHTPGTYRSKQIAIQGSDHTPPEPMQVPDYMEGLLRFVNTPVASQNDLIVTALAHHRMAWIHPFDNGNGRVIRLFTYAMLIKQGFQIKNGRILNPTAVFCTNRQQYYDMLERADAGSRKALLDWVSYVVTGLKEEIEKIDHLLDRAFLTEHILVPALSNALERRHITEQEHEILRGVVKAEDMSIKAGDLERILGAESAVQRSRIVRRLRDKGMLTPRPEHKRIYTIGFLNNYLLRSIIHVMMEEGFVTESLNRREG